MIGLIDVVLRPLGVAIADLDALVSRGGIENARDAIRDQEARRALAAALAVSLPLRGELSEAV